MRNRSRFARSTRPPPPSPGREARGRRRPWRGGGSSQDLRAGSEAQGEGGALAGVDGLRGELGAEPDAPRGVGPDPEARAGPRDAQVRGAASGRGTADADSNGANEHAP